LKAGGNLYERHYWQFDEWTIRLPKAGTSGRVKLGEEIWPEPAFRRSVFYNEFLNQHDICQVAAIPYLDAPGILESVGIYRGSREESFGREQTSVLKMIAPHLQTALETRRRLLALETRISSLETTLDSMSSAVVLIDLAGKAIFVNRQARAILAQTDGIFLHKGRLTGRDSQQTANLRGLIDKAIATSVGESAIGGGAISLPRAAKRPIQILISPIPARLLLLSSSMIRNFSSWFQRTFCARSSG
jgi:PAS domain-containing protein